MKKIMSDNINYVFFSCADIYKYHLVCKSYVWRAKKISKKNIKKIYRIYNHSVKVGVFYQEMECVFC